MARKLGIGKSYKVLIMANAARRPRRKQQEPTWDLVRKRNYVERLKHEKAPLQVIDDLPSLIDRGYEAISEEDVVRLQWYGLYHDKPKVGHFMMRVKLPGGRLTPHELRTIGGISQSFGKDYGELTTRQNIQLHGMKLNQLPEIFRTLNQAGLSTAGGCGDTVRNITGCPVSGLDRDEYFDARPFVDKAADFFYGNPDYCDLPRKHKITISSCPHQCNAPEINCISLIGIIRDGQPGFTVRVGGGLSTWPKLSDDLGVFVTVDDMIPVLCAIIDVWKEELKYRMSRVKSRLKFMVHDTGVKTYREKVEARLGYHLADGQVPAPPEVEYDHAGINPQKQGDLSYIVFPVYLGLCTGTQMIQLADLAESYGGGFRLSRRQNIILTDIPGNQLDNVTGNVADIGFPLEVNDLKRSSIACTGEPFCNYSVGETKHKMKEIVEHMESVFGDRTHGLKLNLDGCPHACAHHWIGDIGLQATTLRERGEGGERLRGYDLFLRGGLGGQAGIGQPILRRVPAGQVQLYVERLYRAFLDGHTDQETIQQFFHRTSDQKLTAIAAGDGIDP